MTGAAGAQLAEPRGSDRGGLARPGVQRRRLGDRMGAAACWLGATRDTRPPAAAVPNRPCAAGMGTGTAGHESACVLAGRLMNDSSRPPLPVSATCCCGHTRWSPRWRPWCWADGPTAAARHVAGADRVDGRSPGAHHLGGTPTARGERQARRPGAAAAYPYHPDLTGNERGAGRPTEKVGVIRAPRRRNPAHANATSPGRPEELRSPPAVWPPGGWATRRRPRTTVRAITRR